MRITKINIFFPVTIESKNTFFVSLHRKSNHIAAITAVQASSLHTHTPPPTIIIIIIKQQLLGPEKKENDVPL